MVPGSILVTFLVSMSDGWVTSTSDLWSAELDSNDSFMNFKTLSTTCFLNSDSFKFSNFITNLFSIISECDT